MKMEIKILLFVLCICCSTQIIGENIVELGHKELEVVLNSSNGWDLGYLFTSKEGVDVIENKKINSFRIEGPSPCVINDPSLMLANSFSHKDELVILDFATVDRYIYYTTEKGVYKTYIHSYESEDQKLKIASVADEYYDYIEGFKLSDHDILLILKGKNPRFSYIITSTSERGETVVETMDGIFEEFTEDMKLTFVNGYLLIPTNEKGIYVYRYNPITDQLEFTEIFADIKNVRDITANPNSDVDKIVGYLCDSSKGIVSYEIDLKTMQITYGDLIKEFTGAYTVNWIFYEKKNKLLTILEGLQDSAKVVILSINIENLKDLTYDSIKLIDGTLRYGNTGNQYASIIMANSIFLMETNKKTDRMYRHINVGDINHAKIYSLGRESWVVYASGKEILGEYIFLHDGFLLCEVASNIKNNEFSILGRSYICGLDKSNVEIKTCYYKVDITLELSPTSYKDRIDKYKVKAYIVLGVTIIVVIFLIIVCIKVIKMSSEAEIRLQGYTKAKKDRDFIGEEVKAVKLGD